MKHLKMWISLILALCLVMLPVLAGIADETGAQEQEVVVDEPAPAPTEAPAPEPTPEPTAEPTEAPAPEVTAEPATETSEPSGEEPPAPEESGPAESAAPTQEGGEAPAETSGVAMDVLAAAPEVTDGALYVRGEITVETLRAQIKAARNKGATVEKIVIAAGARLKGKGKINLPVENSGTIVNGTYTKAVVNLAGGKLTSKASFADAVKNLGTIDGGSFQGAVENAATGVICNSEKWTPSFSGSVKNLGKIDGGVYTASAVVDNGDAEKLRPTPSPTPTSPAAEETTDAPKPEPTPEPEEGVILSADFQKGARLNNYGLIKGGAEGAERVIVRVNAKLHNYGAIVRATINGKIFAHEGSTAVDCSFGKKAEAEVDPGGSVTVYYSYNDARKGAEYNANVLETLGPAEWGKRWYSYLVGEKKSTKKVVKSESTFGLRERIYLQVEEADPNATATPTPTPKVTDTPKPTATPTTKPSGSATRKPTVKPTIKPTIKPTVKPTGGATATATATATVTKRPTPKPTATPRPTNKPSSGSGSSGSGSSGGGSSGSSSGSSGGSSSDSYSWEEEAADGEVEEEDLSYGIEEELSENYLEDGGEMGLDILQDDTGANADYELVAIPAMLPDDYDEDYGELDYDDEAYGEDALAMGGEDAQPRIPGEADANGEMPCMLFVRAKGVGAHARMLTLTLTQIQRLWEEQEVEVLLFRNGATTISVGVEQLFEGKVAKLMELMRAWRDNDVDFSEYDLSTIDFDAIEAEPEFSEDELREFRLELSIAPAEPVGYQVRAELYLDDQSVEVGGLLEDVGITLHAQTVTQQVSVFYVDENQEKHMLESHRGQVPGVEDSLEGYEVLYEDGDSTVLELDRSVSEEEFEGFCAAGAAPGTYYIGVLSPIQEDASVV